MIAALLLAAGASRRFGGPKLLQLVRGASIVRWSAEAALAAADQLLVVVPPEHSELRTALDGLDVRFVVNERAEDGMGSSLACGVRAAGPDVDAALVVLADEPELPAESYRRVIRRYRDGGAQIVAATYAGQRGHPVLFDCAVFPELVALTGDEGARRVVDRDTGRLVFVEIGDQRPIDVDTREDLARLLR
jgi:molybdenum cofactor cytidylyltransferase